MTSSTGATNEPAPGSCLIVSRRCANSWIFSPEFAAAPAYDLTTYRQPIEAMVAAMVGMIRGKARPESLRLRGRFVERGSA